MLNLTKMFKNYDEFLNESSNIKHNFGEDGTELTSEHDVSIPYLAYLTQLLKDCNLTIDGDRDLKVEFNEDQLEIRLEAETVEADDDDDEKGAIVYFYTYYDESWVGGYAEDVKIDDSKWTQGGSENPMTPEEFLECLYNFDVLSLVQHDNILKKLDLKFPQEKIGRNYGV